MRSRWVLLAMLPLVPALWGFTPFTTVPTVCPACPTGSDLMVLTTGTRVPCTVVAQNDDYFVVSAHGELRAVLKTEITSIKWHNEAGGSALPSGDQVLLKNGVVLHGTVVEEQAGRYLVIQVGSLRHVVWFSQMEKLYRGGKAQSLTP